VFCCLDGFGSCLVVVVIRCLVKGTEILLRIGMVGGR